MDISGAAGYTPARTDHKGDSFAESMQKEGAAQAIPQQAFARSFYATDLATNFSYVSPDFMPQGGEGMVDAIALGKGAIDEMQRYEELTKYR